MTAADFQKFGEALFDKLKEAKSPSHADVEAIISGLIDGLEKSNGLFADRFIQGEIRDILAQLSSTREQINEVNGTGFSRERLMDANLSLDEVVQATEAATNRILDAADVINQKLEGIEEAKKQEIAAQITEIFEACNFQDLTGQRIKKVIATLEYIDTKLTKIAAIYGISQSEDWEANKTEEQRLMNGPQHNGQGHSQADIDNLFN